MISPESAIAGFVRESFAHNGVTHDVYSCGTGSPVLVMHELPGLATPAVNFGRRLVQAGFRVYLPHLFGELLSYRPMRNYIALCISAEFGRLRAGIEAPITGWLRALADRIAAPPLSLSAEAASAAPASRVGVIGMCLTGNFVIPLILSRGVSAAVASQPAIPFSLAHYLFDADPGSAGRELNVSDDQLAQAARRAAADHVPIVALRFDRDRICVHQKMERYREAFGDQLTCHELLTPPIAPGQRPPHAVLTEEFDKGNLVAIDAHQSVIEFLISNL
jgi:dienelactone hydrolase